MKYLNLISSSFSIILIYFIVLSCNDNDTTLLEPEYGVDFTFSQSIIPTNNLNKRSIIKIVIHRPKRDCLYGLGICEICIGCPDVSERENNNSANMYSIPINIKYDGLEVGLKNSRYFELLLNNKLDSKFDSTFYIDEDLYLKDNLFIQKGIIKLDESLGNFGGYRIPIVD